MGAARVATLVTGHRSEVAASTGRTTGARQRPISPSVDACSLVPRAVHHERSIVSWRPATRAVITRAEALSGRTRRSTSFDEVTARRGVGRLMFDASWARPAPVVWLGHDAVAKGIVARSAH